MAEIADFYSAHKTQGTMPSTAFLIRQFIVAAHHVISWRYQVTCVCLLRNIGEKSQDLQDEKKRGKLFCLGRVSTLYTVKDCDMLLQQNKRIRIMFFLFFKC